MAMALLPLAVALSVLRRWQRGCGRPGGSRGSGVQPGSLYVTFSRRLHISPFQANTFFFLFVIPISFPGLCGLRAQQSLRSEVTPGTSSLFYMQMALHLGSRAGSQTV